MKDKQQLEQARALIARFADQKRQLVGILDDLEGMVVAVLGTRRAGGASEDALADLRVRANLRLQTLLEHSRYPEVDAKGKTPDR